MAEVQVQKNQSVKHRLYRILRACERACVGICRGWNLTNGAAVVPQLGQSGGWGTGDGRHNRRQQH